MSETEPFFMCLRTISILFSVNYQFIIFAHFVLIVALFYWFGGALYMSGVPFPDTSFKLVLPICVLLLLIEYFTVIKKKIGVPVAMGHVLYSVPRV